MRRLRPVVIKGSSLPVLRIVVRDGDVCSLRRELAETVENARPLLAEAIAVLDLRERNASEAGSREIVAAVRGASVRLAAVLIGDANERESLADLDIPVIEAPISTRERSERGVGEDRSHPNGSEPVEHGVDATITPPATGPALAPAYLTRPLRSGQRFYAQGRDVVVAAPTSRGSELIADGSIYAFSPIRGRVLAGASGNTSACIVASHLDAELVAVAGVYRTLEAVDLQILGDGPVSLALSQDADGGERLTLAPLAPSSHQQRR